MGRAQLVVICGRTDCIMNQLERKGRSIVLPICMKIERRCQYHGGPKNGVRTKHLSLGCTCSTWANKCPTSPNKVYLQQTMVTLDIVAARSRARYVDQPTTQSKPEEKRVAVPPVNEATGLMWMSSEAEIVSVPRSCSHLGQVLCGSTQPLAFFVSFQSSSPLLLSLSLLLPLPLSSPFTLRTRPFF